MMFNDVGKITNQSLGFENRNTQLPETYLNSLKINIQNKKAARIKVTCSCD